MRSVSTEKTNKTTPQCDRVRRAPGNGTARGPPDALQLFTPGFDGENSYRFKRWSEGYLEIYRTDDRSGTVLHPSRGNGFTTPGDRECFYFNK